MAEADISGRYYQPPVDGGQQQVSGGAERLGADSRRQHASDPGKPKNVKTVLLVGAHRSGKTSIQRVVFHKMSPHETLFLTATGSDPAAPGPEVKLLAYNSWAKLEIWDFPGDYPMEEGAIVDGRQFTEEELFARASAIVFVMDAQDAPYTHAIELLHSIVLKASTMAPDVPIEVFVHKMDGDLFQSMEHRAESHARFQGQVEQELMAGGVLSHMLTYHQTSIYDHSVFEAFSRVVQKMLPQLPTLVGLLDTFVRMCDAEKAFLCDVVSKLYLATDSSPMDEHTHELCSDMLDVIVDISCIYGPPPEDLDDVAAPPGALADTGSINGGGTGPTSTAVLQEEAGPFSDFAESFAFDSQSESSICLGNGMALFLRQVSPSVAVVCLLKQDALEQRGLVAYNVDVLKKSLSDVFATTPRKPPAHTHASSSIPIAGAGAIVGSYPPPSSMAASWGGLSRYGGQAGASLGGSFAKGGLASRSGSPRKAHEGGMHMARAK